MNKRNPIFESVRIGIRYKKGLPEKVGEIVESPISRRLIFVTERKYPQHFYRKLEGYPISVKILDKLSKAGIEEIIIHESGRIQNHVYKAKVSQYQEQESFTELNYDMQKCLPLLGMVKIH